MADVWRVVKDPHGHVGMREVIGPALRCIGFTRATNVDAARAQLVEEHAALIAAAPELLAALKALHDDIAEYARINNLGRFDNHVMRQARAAIAKAEEPVS